MTPSGTAFANLQGHSYANLTTFRKNGKAVSTPVWFASKDEKLYIMTTVHTGKVKRIRNNPQVTLEPATGRGKSLGPAAGGTARILPHGEDMIAKQALASKYGWQVALFNLMLRLRGKMRDQVHLEIVPNG